MIDAPYQLAEAVGISELITCVIDTNRITLTVRRDDKKTSKVEFVSYKGGIAGIFLGAGEKVTAIDIEHSLESCAFRAVEESEQELNLKTDALSITIAKAPYRMIVRDVSGTILLEEQPFDVDPINRRRMKPFGFSVDEADRIIGSNLCFNLPYNEHFYGFGESFTSFDKRGLSVDIWNIDALGVRSDEAYKNIPFFISSRGYGFYLNHAAASRFQMGSVSNASWQVHARGEGLEYLIIPGDNASEIIGNFTSFSGRSPLPPVWSFGLWVSNGFFNADRKSMVETATALRKLKIPSDVLHFDCYWLNDKRWCDLEWNTDRFPEPQQLLQHLSKEGFHSSLWINPYVSVRSPMYEEGKEKGFFLKDPSGSVLIRDVWHSLEPECAFIDFTSEAEVNWYKEKLSRLIDTGAAALKTDFGEDIPEEAVFADGSTGREMHNLYALYYNRTVFELLVSRLGEGLVWGRSGFTGSQKYPVCWSGDPATSFPAMAAVLRGGLSYGVSGIPFWSHDIGGFYGAPPTPELYIRWAQFGLFSSHSRCHGTTSRNPWEFGEAALELFTKYVNLRYSLLPYIVSQARECVETGLPFIRPLWINSFSDPATLSIEDQYFFGSDIMVAPVLDTGESRTIYLPEGIWYDFHTKKQLEGPRWITYAAPIDILPLFIRSGVILPRLNREISHTGEINWAQDLYLDRYGTDVPEKLRWYSPLEKRWIELNSMNVPSPEVVHR
jgi:alpha-D-xyloside xylohydrolase